MSKLLETPGTLFLEFYNSGARQLPIRYSRLPAYSRSNIRLHAIHVMEYSNKFISPFATKKSIFTQLFLLHIMRWI